MIAGRIRGVGPVHATKPVRAFGPAVFQPIEQEPGRLREVTGVGPAGLYGSTARSVETD